MKTMVQRLAEAKEITFTEENKGTLSIRRGGKHIGGMYMATGNGSSVTINMHEVGSLTLQDMEVITEKLRNFHKWYESHYGDR